MPAVTRNCLLALGAAFVLAGCGGDEGGSIPQSFSDTLISSLDSAEQAAQEGDCELAQQHADAFATAINSPPEELEDEVQQGLTQAAGNLVGLMSEQCEPTPTGPSGELGVEPPVEAPPVAPPPEETTTTETTTTEEDETDGDGGPPDSPPGQDGSQGGGSGGGAPTGGTGDGND